MIATMKILITEQRPGSATVVAQRLGAAGHTLTYCHAPDGEATCVALSKGGRCPLADVDVSVVVDARADTADMTDSEFGAICAIRHGTPLVVAGPVPNPDLSPWREADRRCDPRDVVAACEEATSPVGATAHREVTAAAIRVMRRFGVTQSPRILLRKRRGAVDAFVITDRALPPGTREAIRIAVRARLASYTPHWQYGDVIFRP